MWAARAAYQEYGQKAVGTEAPGSCVHTQRVVPCPRPRQMTAGSQHRQAQSVLKEEDYGIGALPAYKSGLQSTIVHMGDRCRNSPPTPVLCARSRSGPRRPRAAADLCGCCDVQKAMVVFRGPPVRDIASQKQGYAPILRPSFLHTHARGRRDCHPKKRPATLFGAPGCSPAIQSCQPRNHEGQVLSLTKLARFRRPARRHSAPRVAAYLTSARCVRSTRNIYLARLRTERRASRATA